MPQGVPVSLRPRCRRHVLALFFRVVLAWRAVRVRSRLAGRLCGCSDWSKTATGWGAELRDDLSGSGVCRSRAHPNQSRFATGEGCKLLTTKPAVGSAT